MGVAAMDDLTQIEQLLDTDTLTIGELLVAGLVVLIAALAARWARRGVRAFLESRENVAPHLPELIGRMTGWVITLLGIVAALMIIGVQMGPVVLLLVLFAVLVAVSARSLMENFAAGLSLQITSPFVVGDRIETSGVTGWVEAVTARAVVLTSRDRRTVYVPNSKVIDSVLFNYTDDDQRRSEVAFAVGYGYKMSRVREVATSAVAMLGVVHDEPQPVAYIDELGDDGVNMKMRFYHSDGDRIAARDQVAETIMTSLSDGGFEMPTPEIVVQPPSPTGQIGGAATR
jgi:small conductance mechanosensitive channel